MKGSTHKEKNLLHKEYFIHLNVEPHLAELIRKKNLFLKEYFFHLSVEPHLEGRGGRNEIC